MVWKPFRVNRLRAKPTGIIADPPWRFSDTLTMSTTRRGAESNYSLMSTADIAALPVSQVVADDSLLVLWVPSALLADGLLVLSSWGFNLKGTFIWVKTTKEGWAPMDDGLWSYSEVDPNLGLGFFMGHTFRQCHEIALVGVRGSPKIVSRSQRSVCLGFNQGHSRKPDDLHDRIEALVDGPYLELFGRRLRDNWMVLGNEIDGRDIRHSLPSLTYHFSNSATPP